MAQGIKKQVAVVASKNAECFQRDVNRALKGIENPKLVFYKNCPYILYIIYDVTENENHKI